MKHHAIWIVSATTLLTACGSGEPDPMPMPRSEDGSEAAREYVADAGADTSDEAAPDIGTNEDARSSEGNETQLDTEAALAEPVSDGTWVTQPNWTGFGPPNSEAVFMVECGEYGMIRLTRLIDIESPNPLRAAIAAGEESDKGYWKIEDTQKIPSAQFELYAEAPVFNAMKDADKIAVLAEGKPNLIVSGSQQLTQQINSCQEKGSGTP